MGAVSALPGMKVPDFYFVFTDGNSNFGKEDPGDFKSPVYVFSGSSSANHPLLRYLARKTGGIYFTRYRGVFSPGYFIKAMEPIYPLP